MPPMAGLHDIWPIKSRLSVTSAVLAPRRAAAEAASHPAWPPPITITSKTSSNTMALRKNYHLLTDTKSREDASQDFVRGGLSGDLTKKAQRAMQTNQNQLLTRTRLEQLFRCLHSLNRTPKQIMMPRVRYQQPLGDCIAVLERVEYSSPQLIKSAVGLC